VKQVQMKMILKIFLHTLAVVFLTVITQIGGLVYLFGLMTNLLLGIDCKWKKMGVFIGGYLFFVFLVVPLIAPVFGREKVKVNRQIRPTNYMTILLNRNYVRPALNDLLAQTARNISASGGDVEIRFLDANFPFFIHFPLLPPLIHHDGKKIDISFVYESQDGKLSNKKKSISGYGAFTSSGVNELNQTQVCKSKGYWQYDFTKYFTLGKINHHLVFSEKGTKILMRALLRNKKLGKIFIEPHLKQRLGLTSNKIRFHGCQAVRHDDHIHIQLR